MPVVSVTDTRDKLYLPQLLLNLVLASCYKANLFNGAENPNVPLNAQIPINDLECPLNGFTITNNSI
jgi:hypothetical protein